MLATPVATAYDKANPDLVLSPYISFKEEDVESMEQGVAIAVKKGNQELVDS